MRYLIALILTLLASAPALAQWQYQEGAEEARAFVWNADGTGMGWRCTSRADDRQRILLDLTVVPLTTAPDDEEIARFSIGSWDFSAEVFPVGDLRNGRQRYESRLDYMHPVNQRMRAQVASGSRVRFEQTFDFAAMSFGLRGSRGAMQRLEAACPRLWAGQRPPSVPQPPRAQIAPPPAALSVVPPDASAALQGYVRDLIASQCADPTTLVLPETVFRATGSDIEVQPGRAQCRWSAGINPYCGASRCEAWVYRYGNGQFDLIQTFLR